MLTRRTFLQLAALAATCSPALALSPGNSLRAEVSATVKEGVLIAELTVHNDGDCDVDVMFERGSGAGISLEGWIDGALLPVVAEPFTRQVMTRAAPRRFFMPIKAKGTVGIEGYRFQLPEQLAAGAKVSFVVTLETHEGVQRLPAGEVPVA